MSMLTIVLVFNRYHEKLISEILTNAYGFPTYAGLGQLNVFVRLPILFGLFCVIYAAGWIVYKFRVFATTKLNDFFRTDAGEISHAVSEVANEEIAGRYQG